MDNKSEEIGAQLREEIVWEIKQLFSDKENLGVNIRMIKELTLVLKELERIFEKSDEEVLNRRFEQQEEFYRKIKEKTIIKS